MIVHITGSIDGHGPDDLKIGNIFNITDEEVRQLTAVQVFGKDLIKVGDYVEYGFMQGHVERFGLSDGGIVLVKLFGEEECYSVKNMSPKIKLPSRFQTTHLVKCGFTDLNFTQAKVLKVHFAGNKISYDLEVFFFRDGEDRSNIPISSSRIYNVDETLLEPFE